MKHGIPFNVAFELDQATRAAWCIVFSEFEGATFDWGRMQFEEKK